MPCVLNYHHFPYLFFDKTIYMLSHEIDQLPRTDVFMDDKIRILLVEDEQIHQEYIKSFLQQQALHADEAETIQEAASALRSALAQNMPYNLLLIDIMLPDGTGHDLLELLTRDDYLCIYKSINARLIMITAMGELKHSAGAFAEGCDPYLVKPVREEQLLSLLKRFKIL